jgi:hypothetical protein
MKNDKNKLLINEQIEKINSKNNAIEIDKKSDCKIIDRNNQIETNSYTINKKKDKIDQKQNEKQILQLKINSDSEDSKDTQTKRSKYLLRSVKNNNNNNMLDVQSNKSFKSDLKSDKN